MSQELRRRRANHSHANDYAARIDQYGATKRTTPLPFEWHSSKFMPKFHHKTVATVMLNLRVEHMLYRVIDYPGRPDPGFNLTKILRNPYSEIQNASTRATNVIGLETTHTNTLRAAATISDLTSLAFQCNPSRNDIRDILAFYQENGTGAVSPSHWTHQKLEVIVAEIPQLVFTVNQLLDVLVEIASSVEQTIKAKTTRKSWKLRVWTFLKLSVAFTNILACLPYPDLYEVAEWAILLFTGLLLLWEALLGTPPYHVVYDPVHRDIEHRLELYGIHPLIRECHVFLGVLGELDDHLRSLHEIGAEYWDARVEGVLKVYLFNYELDLQQLSEFGIQNAGVAPQLPLLAIEH